MKRLKVKAMRLFSKKSSLEKDERYVESIISKYLETGVKKLMSPNNEYLIIDKNNQIYISLKGAVISISNHDFLYRKSFSSSFSERLEKKIEEAIKKEREQLRNALFKNEIDLLEKIRDRI